MPDKAKRIKRFDTHAALASNDRADVAGAAGLREFLSLCAGADWRTDPVGLPGEAAARPLETWAIAEMRRRRAISAPCALRGAILVAAAGPDGGTDGAGVEWLADRLLVLQLGTAVRDLVAQRHPNFDCSSVPDGIFWRKNAARDWPTHCLPDRYGWISDAESARHLLAVLLADGSGERFSDAMGFTRVEGADFGGYGPMYFMFYTLRQLERLPGVEIFRPLWPDIYQRLRARFAALASRGEEALAAKLPAMWAVDIGAWEDALESFEVLLPSLSGDGRDKARRRFLEFSIRACKPLWEDSWAPGSVDPRWHPVAAVRHLLDQWFGANHLFMGDGFAWSEAGERGFAEWLLSSFDNHDVARVPIFRGLEAPKVQV